MSDLTENQSAKAALRETALALRDALPAIAGRGKPLIVRAWKFGDPLKAGQWGIREPVPEAPEVAPDILIVPLA
ncbi:MAG: 5-formyltetrahydrofolate cyclo-ligase, partial [Pseudolabrys sp.]